MVYRPINKRRMIADNLHVSYYSPTNEKKKHKAKRVLKRAPRKKLCDKIANSM